MLSNILFHGLESVHPCVRVASEVLFFLKPLDDELIIVKKVKTFFLSIGINSRVDFTFSSIFEGFEILVWFFKLSSKKSFICLPSKKTYRKFLIRFKRIINNSNYGSEVKATKISPLIKEWNLYHRFTLLKNSKFSLFYLKKRCLKTFAKETKHDFYSSKNLLDKCFSKINFSDIKNFERRSHFSPYFGHLVFWFRNENLIQKVSLKNYFCIHCGTGFFL